MMSIGATAARAAPPIKDCAELLLVFAQGSGQNPDEENAEQTASFLSEIRKLTPPGLDIIEYRLGKGDGYGGSDYPAVGPVGGAWSWPVGDDYFASMYEGVNELVGFLTDRHRECPSEAWILGGFSQGGQVITTALAHYLPSAVMSQVGYAATFGDPTLEAGEPGFFSCSRHWYTRGSVLCFQYGVLWSFGRPPDEMRGRFGAWCGRDDGVCASAANNHTNYVDGYTAEAAKEALSTVRLETGWALRPGVGSSGVDLMVVMDTTGSMGSTIAGAKESALEIAQKITSNYNGRVGLVQFRDASDSPDVSLELALTGDVDEFATAIEGLSASGGGDTPEAQLAGISTALEGTSSGNDWRRGGTKLLAVFTDAPGKDPDPILGITREQVIQRALEIDPVGIYGVNVGGSSSVASWMQPLADGTGGAIINGTSGVTEAFDKLLTQSAMRPVVVVPEEAYGNLGAPITLSAEGSYDPDSTIRAYKWDLDGDGVFEAETAEPTISHEFGAVGDQNVGVLAVAEDGGVGAGFTRVRIFEEWTTQFDPGTPQSTKAVQSGATSARISWEPPAGASVAPDRYLVSSSGGEVTTLVESSDLSAELSDLVPGREYVFEIRAIAAGFHGEPASTDPLTVDQEVPDQSGVPGGDAGAPEPDTSASPPSQPPTPQPSGAQTNPCGVPGSAGYLNPSKLRVSRARVLRGERAFDVLAPITSRARGDVAVTFFADQRIETFDADVTSGNAELDRIRFMESITAGQAKLGTGIVILNYLGDEDTRPQVVRLRAASQRAELDVEQISLITDRFSAKGSVTGRAEGIVRFRYSYVDPSGAPQVHEARAEIQDDGDWQLEDDQVPAQLAQCGGYLSVQFTGYFPRRIRGEQLAYQLNPGQTRRP
jgi:Mg-chelatase subunit ChlD